MEVLARLLSLLQVVVLLGGVCIADSKVEYTSNTYDVYSINKTKCMSMKIGAHFSVPYSVNASDNTTASISLPAPSNTTIASGECPKTDGMKTGTASLTVKFGKNSDQVFRVDLAWNATTAGQSNSVTWSVSKITFTFALSDEEYFPNAEFKDSIPVSSSSTGISASGGQSFRCDAETKLELAGDGQTVDMLYKGVLFNPFNADSGHVTVCAADSKKTDKIVPIAVGCALAGLLLIVIVAWLVGRKSKKSGYKEV